MAENEEGEDSIADLVVQGIFCQECLCPFDNDDWPNAEKMAGGHPRYCRACGGDPKCNGASKEERQEE